MTEKETRLKIVNEAQSWIGTPYHSGGKVKGKRGGVDCAMFPLLVYKEAGCIPLEFEPEPYSPQWHVHRSEEKYLNYILQFAKEVASPPEREPKPGDFILFKIALAFGHGAIIINWPTIIHAIGNDIVTPEDISKNLIGKRALWKIPQRFFSLWN